MVPGCSTPLYEWGDYQGSLYRQFKRDGASDLGEDTRRLQAQVENSIQRGRVVPPGVRAHIGYLCYLAGDGAGAEAHFNAEKAAFPESAVFVDGTLARMRR
jgi:hypothetical protein